MLNPHFQELDGISLFRYFGNMVNTAHIAKSWAIFALMMILRKQRVVAA